MGTQPALATRDERRTARQYRFEIDEASPLLAAIEAAVATVTDRPIDRLPPLEHAVDADTLDALYRRRTVRGRVSLRYAGYDVCIDYEAGEIQVSPSS